MTTIQQKVDDFLAQKCLAVVGVSRTARGEAANLIYQKLKASGYRVYPVNPHAREVQGDRCYPNVQTIPEAVEGVVIVTRPEVAEEIVRECAEAGISRVWMHRSVFGEGSVSGRAVQFCQEHQIEVIGGACPMMFCEPVDIGHKCMRWMLRISGKLPK